MATKKVSRDAGTGRFVTEKYAQNHLKNDFVNVNLSFG